MNDPAQREHVAEIGGDPEHQHERYIENINRALAGRPADLAVTTHMCRGNNQSMWAAEGGYEFVAEALFNELDVDGFFCEWDDERSGGFEPLRFVPKGKRVVLGLVTTKRGELESKDAAQAADRGRGPVRRRRSAVPVPAVRLLLDQGGQRPHPATAVGQAPADRRDRTGGLGHVVTQHAPVLVVSAHAGDFVWRAGGAIALAAAQRRGGDRAVPQLR